MGSDVIYMPKGRAREYSPWALNIYTKCAHGCHYCYCKRFGDFFDNCPSPRKDIIERLAHQLDTMHPDGQVLLSFMGDPYGPSSDDNAATRVALAMLYAHRVPVAILTKAGRRCLRDIDLFKLYGPHIQVGATLTYVDKGDSQRIEPGAALAADRLHTLLHLHDEGIRTFASMEPLLDARQSLDLIHWAASHGAVDVFKLGKANNYSLDEPIDYESYLAEALTIIHDFGATAYVKDDLAAMVPDMRFFVAERDPDATCVRW